MAGARRPRRRRPVAEHEICEDDPVKDDERRWIAETVNDREGYRVELAALGAPVTVDGMHDLALFENPTFGRVLILDGAVQVTTADEFIYHEAMAHVPLFAHGGARRVLIIGGGDGGIAREALRHPGLERVTLVEIDRAVVDLAVRLLPEIAGGAFDDPRLDLIIDDGARFVETTRERFDVVIVDSPDPVGPGKALFEPAFYAACRRLLTARGILVTQSGMPFLTADWFAGHAETLRTVFTERRFFLSTVPSYAGGPMAHGFMALDPASAMPDEATLAARAAASGLEFAYWTPALHRAAFALPGYVARLIR